MTPTSSRESVGSEICKHLFIRKLFQESFLDENQVVVPASKYDVIREVSIDIII